MYSTPALRDRMPSRRKLGANVELFKNSLLTIPQDDDGISHWCGAEHLLMLEVQHYTVVTAMYRPRHEQTPSTCGHVSIYGYFPNEIPCQKRPPA